MEKLIFEERKSKILTLQQNINIINTEQKVRKPHPSIKTLFNGNFPKNRKNLKKLDNILNNLEKKSPKKKTERPPTIQSLIDNSKSEEFLTKEKPNNYQGYKIIPLKNFSSSSTLYSINNNNNHNNISNHIENGNNFVNLDLRYLNSADSLPELNGKKMTKMSKKKSSIKIQQEKDLNQLYQELIDNVSNISNYYLL